MRARSLKPGLFRNEILGKADPLLTILFEGLWCSADREGRLEDRPLRLCAEVFPYRRRITEKKLDVMLQWLHDQKFIVRYQVEGKRYIQVLEFRKHQNPHKKEAPSIIPPLSSLSHSADTVTSTIQERNSNEPNTERAGLTPSSLTPDSLTPVTRTPSNGASEHRSSDREKGRYPPDFDHHAEFKRIRAIYPPFTGRQDWITTEHHCRLRIDEGSTWDELIDGVTRYRHYCDNGGVSSPKYVMSPVKFFSAADRPWKQPWDPPPPPEPKDAKQPPTLTHEQREAIELQKLKGRRESIGIAGFRDPRPGETAADYRRAQDDEWSERQAKLRTGLARGELPGIAKGMP